jgi:alpha-glucosidase (family GH31 glycosyl hydrolase)
MGMQGLAYMHSDLGGFAGANLDDELYARWLQYGVFNPVFRPHSQEDVPSEPVFRSEKAKALAKEAIELRYKLLPYNYNLVYENNQFGKPLMRPLFFEEPNNKKLFDYSKTYLWGNDILVSPVLEAGLAEQEVYFPKDNIWFDFYTHEKFEGGQTKTVQLKENSIPTYVRAGSFVPLTNVIQSTIEYDSVNYELHYYYDGSITKSVREFYNDRGNEKSNEVYEIINYTAKSKRNVLNFEFEMMSKVDFDYLKSIKLVIHNVVKKPKSITVSNNKEPVNWDSEKNMLTIPLKWFAINKFKTIKIKLNK